MQSKLKRKTPVMCRDEARYRQNKVQRNKARTAGGGCDAIKVNVNKCKNMTMKDKHKSVYKAITGTEQLDRQQARDGKRERERESERVSERQR